MTFRDLDEFLDDTLPLPIGGRVYVVADVDAETGLLCQRLFAAGADAYAGREPHIPAELDDGQELDLYQRVLGDTYAQMVSGGVHWQKISLAAQTTIAWIAVGRDAAEQVWNSGGRPEQQAPNREARRTASKATAKSTRSRGSTSTTGSPRRKANGSAGRKSSNTGP